MVSEYPDPQQGAQYVPPPRRSVPSLLEYLSYTFNFHSILIGPGYTMREHLSFIDGSNLAPLENPNQFARVS